MQKHHHITALALMTGLLFTVAHAQETTSRATILAVTGSAQVKLPDGSTVPATVGLTLAQGAAVSTGNGSQVAIEVHPGIVAVLAGSSHVGIEKLSVSANGTRNAMMNLTTGNLGSSLDPARKSVNNYGVRTARGVAMARGTTMTVSVNGNNYTVSVLNGTVTVNWSGGLSVSIVGNTPSNVTSNGGPPVSLHDALASGSAPGLTDALTAAAAAVATVATNTVQVTAVIDAIATAAGTNSAASATVAGATAAATGAAVGNSTLVAAAGGSTTSVASTISTAAVTSATAAGNGGAAQLIVTSAVNAVVNTIPGTNVSNVATVLTSAANTAQGNQGNSQIIAGQVTAGVNAAQNPVTAVGYAVGNPNATTPITPIDPSFNVSPSGG